MIKFLFFDYRQIETIAGFERRLEPPRKHSQEPILDSIQTWGEDWLSMYGSVIRRPDDGLFQMWYTTLASSRFGTRVLGYAESHDGIEWERPRLDILRVKQRKTNIVFERDPHGATVYYDPEEPRVGWKYKLLAGAYPSGRIGAFRSPDGIHWEPAAENPVIGTNPDCPMSFCRMPDGRYVAFHRPGFADRRVGRTESWNFRNFSEPVVVMEPDQNDPPNTQFYGLGAVPYGAYLIGSLWIYHTDADDLGFYKMGGYQEPEFVHSRGSYCWHRTAQGQAWIPVEKDESRFDSGQIQSASQPVFLDDEVRFYYVGTRTRHGVEAWHGKGPRAGVGFASCKPDRFVGVWAKGDGRLLTRPFWTETPRFCVNAQVGRDGGLQAEILNTDGTPIPGFTMTDAVPASGDSTEHVLAWKGNPDVSTLARREIRVRIQCRNATLYSLYAGTEEEARRYWDFRISSFINLEREQAMPWVKA